MLAATRSATSRLAQTPGPLDRRDDGNTNVIAVDLHRLIGNNQCPRWDFQMRHCAHTCCWHGRGGGWGVVGGHLIPGSTTLKHGDFGSLSRLHTPTRIDHSKALACPTGSVRLGGCKIPTTEKSRRVGHCILVAGFLLTTY